MERPLFFTPGEGKDGGFHITAPMTAGHLPAIYRPGASPHTYYAPSSGPAFLRVRTRGAVNSNTGPVGQNGAAPRFTRLFPGLADHCSPIPRRRCSGRTEMGLMPSALHSFPSSVLITDLQGRCSRTATASRPGMKEGLRRVTWSRQCSLQPGEQWLRNASRVMFSVRHSLCGLFRS